MIPHVFDKGSTDKSVILRVVDSTDGTPETGVAYNTSGIDLWYLREGGSVVSITEADLAAVNTAHTDGGFKHINNGYCRLDLPDAAYASGAEWVIAGGTITGMIIIGAYVTLTNPVAMSGTSVSAYLRDGAHGGTAAVITAERIVVASTTSNEPGLKITGNGTAAGTLSTGGATGPGIDAVGGGTSGAGMRTRAAAGNSIGLDAVGAGTQPGLKATGGATGHGFHALGGATSGDGAVIAGQTSGHGLTATGVGTTKHGVSATGGSTTSHGISATGGGVGHGILATSGSGSTGDGIRATAASTNGNGLNALGVGTGMGVQGTGGATGHGINGIGGATSGSGLRGVGTAGNSSGVAAVGQGSAAGLQATGGATGAGIRGTGGATSGAGLVAAAAAGNSDGATFTPAGTGLGMNYTNTVAGRIKKNTAFTNFMIKMELTDGSPGTGLTVTVQRAIDGGAFAALAVTTVTEISAGWYKFNLAAADVNGDSIAIKATATGAKQLDLLILTQVAG